MPPKPRHVHVRPTHFLAFPISNPSCQAKSQEVIDVLLQAKPRPDGVDESLAGSPRSLHLTLGIMPLTTEKALQTVKASSSPSQKPLKTVEAAARLLRDCQAGLRELLEEDNIKDIRVTLNRLESFQSDPKECRVLYAEPEKGSQGVETLHSLAAYIRERFHQEGMLADYKQPLTLHCTLMKASARKNMPTKQVKQREGDRPNVRQKQIPRNRDDEDTTASESDSIEAPNPVLEAEGDLLIGEQAIGSLQLPKPDSKPEPKPIPNRHKRKPYRGVPKNHPFDASLVLNANPPYALGETYIDRIHLHQMGKKDETGAYVILEEIKLFD